MTIDELYKKAEPIIDSWPADGRCHSEQDMLIAGPAYKELTQKLVEEWPSLRDRIEALEKEATALRLELEERESKISQAYQVIGMALTEKISRSEGLRALDYFGEPTTYEEDFLPFLPSEALKGKDDAE